MLDLIVRLLICGAILMSTTPRPAQTTVEAGAGAAKARTCPAQWPGRVRTCLA